MKTGIVKKIDDLGRIVIPKEVRVGLDLKIGSLVDMHIEDDKLIISKAKCVCAICGGEDDLVDFKEKRLCKTCAKEIKANF